MEHVQLYPRFVKLKHTSNYKKNSNEALIYCFRDVSERQIPISLRYKISV